MSDTKYYIPTIEEFHVGFEFESEEISSCGASTEFVKTIISKPKDIEDAFTFNDWHSEIRVKHLDREDIESLGFKHIANDWYSTNVIGDGYQIIFSQNNKIHISYGQHEFNTVMFTGTIKNKSELKRILIQLGITKE